MKNKAQSIIEYSIIIAVVTSAFLAMRVYFQRAVQSGLEPLDGQLNPISERYLETE